MYPVIMTEGSVMSVNFMNRFVMSLLGFGNWLIRLVWVCMPVMLLVVLWTVSISVRFFSLTIIALNTKIIFCLIIVSMCFFMC